MSDPNDHAATVDFRAAQVDCFRDAQTGGVAGRQNGVVLGCVDAAEKLHDFLGTENDRKRPRLLGAGMTSSADQDRFSVTG